MTRKIIFVETTCPRCGGPLQGGHAAVPEGDKPPEGWTKQGSWVSDTKTKRVLSRWYWADYSCPCGFKMDVKDAPTSCSYCKAPLHKDHPIESHAAKCHEGRILRLEHAILEKA